MTFAQQLVGFTRSVLFVMCAAAIAAVLLVSGAYVSVIILARLLFG